MIKAVIVINNYGQPRLLKFYEFIEFAKREQIIRECFNIVSRRPDNVCNILEETKTWGKGTKLIYRHYATLFFVFVVDDSESELGILDLIQVFVEALDKNFENVCELDLIFHLDRVHFILDEVIMGGMVLETNLGEIMASVASANKFEKATQNAPKKVTTVKTK